MLPDKIIAFLDAGLVNSFTIKILFIFKNNYVLQVT